MTWFQTYTGRKFDYANPTPDMVDILDISHALANICRFNGHTRIPYSVAQHSVFVASQMPGNNMLECLMHDAAEAYCCDVPKPLKSMLLGYDKIESAIMGVICEKFKLDYTDSVRARIKFLDNVSLMTECRDLMGGPRGGDWGVNVEPAKIRIAPVCAELAEEQFRLTFQNLER